MCVNKSVFSVCTFVSASGNGRGRPKMNVLTRASIRILFILEIWCRVYLMDGDIHFEKIATIERFELFQIRTRTSMLQTRNVIS